MMEEKICARIDAIPFPSIEVFVKGMGTCTTPDTILLDEGYNEIEEVN